MCGISGAVQPLEVALDHVPLIEKIVEDQHSRGPDNAAIQGIASSALRAVFGHNRLAIIDLTANANQPMWHPSRRLCLIYNGEIYNYVELRDELRALGHRFRSESDFRGDPRGISGLGRCGLPAVQWALRLRLVRRERGSRAPRPRPIRCEASLLLDDEGPGRFRVGDSRGMRSSPRAGSERRLHRTWTCAWDL